MFLVRVSLTCLLSVGAVALVARTTLGAVVQVVTLKQVVS